MAPISGSPARPTPRVAALPSPPPPPTVAPASIVTPAPPPPASSPPTASFVDRLIDHLAQQRGGVDPRYDPTLRTYERSLRRFAAYLAKHSSTQAPTEALIDEYLGAVSRGAWPAPASEKRISRTVMNHLRAFLREGAARP